MKKAWLLIDELQIATKNKMEWIRGLGQWPLVGCTTSIALDAFGH